MSAPLRRQTKLIGENWLREGNSESGRNFTGAGEYRMADGEELVAKNQGLDRKGVSHGDVNY